MMVKSKIDHKAYWEKNIAGFSGFYDKRSEETFQCPAWVAWMYKLAILPLEKKSMKERFQMVSVYIQRNVQSKTKVADIGCGGGIYTQQCAALGGLVYAQDFAEAALKLTRERLTGEQSVRVRLRQADILQQSIPEVDVALAIGVLPYIEDLGRFFDNVLPYTRSVLFNFLSRDEWINRLRQQVTLLDVRGYAYHSVDYVQETLREREFDIVHLQKLGTGFMVEAARKAQ